MNVLALLGKHKQRTKYKALSSKSQITDSLPFKLSLSFLQERADALVLVFGRETQGEQIHFAAETLVQI